MLSIIPELHLHNLATKIRFQLLEEHLYCAILAIEILWVYWIKIDILQAKNIKKRGPLTQSKKWDSTV